LPPMTAFDSTVLATDAGLAMGPALGFLAGNAEPTVQEWRDFLTKPFGGLRPLAGMQSLSATAPEIVAMMKSGDFCGGVGAYGMRLQAGKAGKVVVAHNLEDSPDIKAWTPGGAFYQRVESTDPIVLAVRPNAPGTVEVVTGASDATGKTSLKVGAKPAGAEADQYLGAFLVVDRDSAMFHDQAGDVRLSADKVLDAVFAARMQTASVMQEGLQPMQSGPMVVVLVTVMLAVAVVTVMLVKARRKGTSQTEPLLSEC